MVSVCEHTGTTHPAAVTTAVTAEVTTSVHHSGVGGLCVHTHCVTAALLESHVLRSSLFQPTGDNHTVPVGTYRNSTQRAFSCFPKFVTHHLWGFSHRQGGVRGFDASVNILMRGHQI